MDATLIRNDFELDSVDSWRRAWWRNAVRWWVVYSGTILVGLLVAAIAYKRSEQPFIGVAILFLVMLIVGWLRFPRVVLGGMVGLALVGDTVTVSWFPLNKNLSSRESILYVADSVSLSPLELVTLVALGTTIYRNLASIGRPLRRAPLNKAFGIFGVLLAGGFVTGLSNGGDLRVAIYEVRPLILLPLLYVVITNTCRTRTDYRRVYWAALAGIVVQSLLSLNFLRLLAPEVRRDLESLNEHGAAIGMGLLLALFLMSIAVPKVSWKLRVSLFIASVPVIWVYIVAQRRAAFVALAVAMILFAVSLYWRHPRRFWSVVPIVAIIALGYIGAFWNSESSLGFGAQAVKGVLAPDQQTAVDQSSDLYRELEKYNLSETIRAAPVQGLGFGKPFLRPIPLPDISGFEFHQYLPHNSLLWIWIKTGFLGFVTMLYIIARSIAQGVARFRRLPAGTDAIVALGSVLFVVMYSVYLYVEIAWEPRNVVLLALAMGLCTGPLRRDPSELSASSVASPNAPTMLAAVTTEA